MKGRIMAQRVAIAMCGLFIAVSLSITGILWMQSTRQARDMTETNRRIADSLAQNQAANREMLNQLQAMVKAAQTAESSDWIPVTFKLTHESLDGPPAVGCVVHLGSGEHGDANEGRITRVSDSSGVVNFGVVRPGDWGFTIREQWTDGFPWWETHDSFNVLP
jgi:hypothetical protein